MLIIILRISQWLCESARTTEMDSEFCSCFETVWRLTTSTENKSSRPYWFRPAFYRCANLPESMWCDIYHRKTALSPASCHTTHWIGGAAYGLCRSVVMTRTSRDIGIGTTHATYIYAYLVGSQVAPLFHSCQAWQIIKWNMSASKLIEDKWKIPIPEENLRLFKLTRARPGGTYVCAASSVYRR